MVAVDAVQADLKKYLAPFGFRCRGRNFNKKLDDGLVQVVNIWMGPSDPPGTVYIPGLTRNLYGLYSVNLGVFDPWISRCEHGEHFKERSWIAEPWCFIRKRLGVVSGKDCWWQTTQEDQTEMFQLLKIQQVEFFERYSSREKIFDELYQNIDSRVDFQSPRRIVCAMMQLQEGNVDEVVARPGYWLERGASWAFRVRNGLGKTAGLG